jgi:DNA topoisomerase-1
MRLPGGHVFQYVDAEGSLHRADAVLVNEYLRERTGRSFTAKNFRTWKASAVTAGTFFAHRHITSITERKKIIKKAVADGADILGNTATVCRNYYIHAGLLETFEDGSFPQFFQRFAPRPQHHLGVEEVILARFLNRWEPSRMVA